MKPPIITLSPVSTGARVAMLISGDSGLSTSKASTMPMPVGRRAGDDRGVRARVEGHEQKRTRAIPRPEAGGWISAALVLWPQSSLEAIGVAPE